MKNFSRRVAFTLAEVLITLGIIGVVAAITMPVLIQNHKKLVVETRLKKFYSTINQAISMSEAENGERESWEGTNDVNVPEWYNRYLSKYLKTIKIEEIDKPGILAYLPDGSAVVFHGDVDIDFYPEAKNYQYCQNLANPLECSGTKMFSFGYWARYADVNSIHSQTFKFNGRIVSPFKYSWDGKYSTLIGQTTYLRSSRYVCTKELPEEGRLYCTAVIEANNWKIPDDYPLKF